MDRRLINISKAIAQSAINAYSNSSIEGSYYSTDDDVIRKIYSELVIGVKCKIRIFSLAKLITTTAILVHRKNKSYSLDSALFSRAHIAVEATLKKMIRQTNYQRRLQQAMNF